MYSIVRFLLFFLSPEKAHHFTFFCLTFFRKIPGWKFIFAKIGTVRDSNLNVNVFGINFPNPVGLAAGFDKDAKYIDELNDCGFGFLYGIE